jgi:hypothetical protein
MKFDMNELLMYFFIELTFISHGGRRKQTCTPPKLRVQINQKQDRGNEDIKYNSLVKKKVQLGFSSSEKKFTKNTLKSTQMGYFHGRASAQTACALMPSFP